MPVITARLFEYEKLKEHLKSEDKIVVLSCDSCAKKCDGLGGEEGMNSLADKLTADGFKVVLRELCAVACSSEQWEERLAEEVIAKLFKEADVIIPLVCDTGINRAYEFTTNLKLLRVTKTLGVGTAEPEARLITVNDDIDLEIEDQKGITLTEAARQLGLFTGRF